MERRQPAGLPLLAQYLGEREEMLLSAAIHLLECAQEPQRPGRLRNSRPWLIFSAAFFGPVAPSHKNTIGTPSLSAILDSRPGLTRFTPFSYFCSCWNVTSIALARSVCE